MRFSMRFLSVFMRYFNVIVRCDSFLLAKKTGKPKLPWSNVRGSLNQSAAGSAAGSLCGDDLYDFINEKFDFVKLISFLLNIFFLSFYKFLRKYPNQVQTSNQM